MSAGDIRGKVRTCLSLSLGVESADRAAALMDVEALSDVSGLWDTL